jgi:transposase
VVDLVHVCRRSEELAREFESTGQGSLNWVKQADLDEGRRNDVLTTVEREELSLGYASPVWYEMVHIYEA